MGSEIDVSILIRYSLTSERNHYVAFPSYLNLCSLSQKMSVPPPNLGAVLRRGWKVWVRDNVRVEWPHNLPGLNLQPNCMGDRIKPPLNEAKTGKYLGWAPHKWSWIRLSKRCCRPWADTFCCLLSDARKISLWPLLFQEIIFPVLTLWSSVATLVVWFYDHIKGHTMMDRLGTAFYK